MIRKTVFLALLLAAAWLAAAAPALADGAGPSGEPALWPAALAWLVPIGLGMLACGAVPPDRVAAVIRTGWLALSVSAIGYWLAGFAFQFGGVGFVYDHPDLAGLAREWTWAPLDAAWGSQWGAIGLEGYLLRGPASTPMSLRLFLTQLPWIATAVALPLWSLQGRAGPVALFLSGVLQAALYAVAGNWAWGGGWLANLGLNLGLGHGYVDYVGAGPVHLAGAASALAGMLAFGVRPYMRHLREGYPRSAEQLPLPGLEEDHAYVPMPALHLPVLATFGAWLAAVGWLGWTLSAPNYVLSEPGLSLAWTWINLWLAAAGGAVVALFFSWLTTGEGNALMVARGVLGALIAVGPGLPFFPTWAALAVGAGAGLLVPLVQYTVEHLLRFDDPTSAVATHGLPALWGLLAVGLFAAGQAGEGWNRVGTGVYLGVPGQGVSGYLVAAGRASDWPGQFQAQVVGVVAIGVAAFVLSWLLFAALQGLRRAWTAEYTLRLPARQQRPAVPSRAALWARSLRWPTIHLGRREPPAAAAEPDGPAVEALAGAPPAGRRRLDALLPSVGRWAGRVTAAAIAAVRRPARGTPGQEAVEAGPAREDDTPAQEGGSAQGPRAPSVEGDAGRKTPEGTDREPADRDDVAAGEGA